MADLPPTPHIGYAHTSYLLTVPSPAPAASPPDGAALTQMSHWKQLLCGMALALLPSLISFGLGLIIGKADFLGAVGFAAGLGLLYNPAFAVGTMIGLMPTKVSRAVGFGVLAGFLLYFLLDCAITIQLLSMAGFIM